MTLTPKIATISTSREIFLVFRNTVFSYGFRCCNTVIGIYQGDFSTLSHIRFLYSSIIRRLPPLEMTLSGKRHLSKTVSLNSHSTRNQSFRAVVSMLYNSTIKNRYSFNEPRNLSCVREYRAFCRLPLRQSRDRNSKGGAFQFVRRHHHPSFLIFSHRFHHLGRRPFPLHPLAEGVTLFPLPTRSII